MATRTSLFSISGVEPAASSTISPLTAPTAAPSRTRFKGEDIQTFNMLLTQLLSKAQDADATGFRQQEQNLEEEALNRAGMAPTGGVGQLSPGQQAQVRSAKVGAVETPRRIVRSQREEFESKVENIPNL